MSWRYKVLKYLVRNKKLTPSERLASRIGYMGAGFLVAAQWTVEPCLYIAGFCCVYGSGYRQENNGTLVALNL